MALTATIRFDVKAQLTGSGALGSPSAPLSLSKLYDIATGVLAGQADLDYGKVATLAASANEELDLAGSLIDQLGNVITAAKIVAVIVAADPANTNNVIVGNAAATQFVGPFGAAAHTIAVPPGGLFVIMGTALAGIGAVVGGASDKLNFLNSGAGTSVTYSVIILGRSA